MPSEQEVVESGMDVADMNARLLRKVEELTLYIIQQEREMREVKKRLEEVENRVLE